jgi:hypothetical protein
MTYNITKDNNCPARHAQSNNETIHVRGINGNNTCNVDGCPRLDANSTSFKMKPSGIFNNNKQVV